MTPASSRRGFTLLEVTIAVAITAIIGAMALGAFRRAAAARDLTDAQEERFGGARVALSRMARELSEAFLSDHYDRRRYPRERPTVFNGRRDQILFATTAHQVTRRDAKESDQALVEYVLDADAEFPGERALFRREKPSLDDEPDRGGTRAVLCHHVKELEIDYWDWSKQEWAREWSTAPGERPLLPARIRIRLVLTAPDGKEQRFETQARVAIVRPLDF